VSFFPPTSTLHSDSSSAPRQNPQCEGKNKNRLVFNSKASSYASRLLKVQHLEGQYVMQAGAVHDVTKGARYILYENRDCYNKNKSLGTLRSREVKEDTTILEPEHGNLPHPTDDSQLLALKVTAGEDEILPIYAPDRDPTFPILRGLEDEGNTSNRLWQIKLVPENHKSFMALSVTDDHQVSVRITDEQSSSYGMGLLSRSLGLEKLDENLAEFLRGVFHFHHQLKRQGSLSYPQAQIQIEFSELVRSPEIDRDTFRYIYKPKTKNGEVVNLIEKEEVHLQIEDRTFDKGQIMTPERYGFTIRNNSDKPLYVSLFYFDMSEFNISECYSKTILLNSMTDAEPTLILSAYIVSYYQPAYAGSGIADPCLPPGGTLSIGHGLSSSPAWQYGLAKDQDVDLGYLRFFFSREPLDLSYLPQLSAFDNGRLCQEAHMPKSPMLYTKTIPIVQRRMKKYL
jgi:hypothetical protein